jgi:hypothetical protein
MSANESGSLASVVSRISRLLHTVACYIANKSIMLEKREGCPDRGRQSRCVCRWNKDTHRKHEKHRFSPCLQLWSGKQNFPRSAIMFSIVFHYRWRTCGFILSQIMQESVNVQIGGQIGCTHVKLPSISQVCTWFLVVTVVCRSRLENISSISCRSHQLVLEMVSRGMASQAGVPM